jgi:hypothetical protein
MVLVWEPAMVEAVRTTASPAAIWAIVVVAVGCLVFWLVAIWVADKNPVWRHWQAPEMPGPVLGGIHAAEGGRSVAPNREAPAVFTEPPPEVPAQRVPGQVVTPVAEQAPAAAPALPPQRSADADQPEHTVTGTSAVEGSAGES